MSALEDRESLVQDGELKLKECTGTRGEIRLNQGNADIATCKSTPPPQVL